jgi:hypothetical protein
MSRCCRFAHVTCYSILFCLVVALEPAAGNNVATSRPRSRGNSSSPSTNTATNNSTGMGTSVGGGKVTARSSRATPSSPSTKGIAHITFAFYTCLH